MIRVMVADDHPVVRAGIKAILARDEEILVVDEASTAQEALEKARRGVCDVLTLDLNMPGRQGLDLLPQLHKEAPKVRVLVMSVHPEEEYAERCLRAGAAGYLSKARAPDDLVRAVVKVAGGGLFVSASLGEWLASKLGSEGSRAPHECLSDREYLVLRRLASGNSCKEIADELSLSVKTVSTYRTRLLAKMGMRKNSELIRYGIEHHFSEEP